MAASCGVSVVAVVTVNCGVSVVTVNCGVSVVAVSCSVTSGGL